MKAKGKDIWGFVYPILIYLGITYAIQYILVIIAGFLVGMTQSSVLENGIIGSREQEMIIQLVNGELMPITALSAFVTVPILLALMYNDICGEKMMGMYRKYHMVNPMLYLLIIPLGICAMFMGNALVNYISLFLPESLAGSYDETAEILYGTSIQMQILTTVIAAPIVEELVFRGLAYNRIRRVSNDKIAIVVSALLFGVFHMNFVQGVYAFVIGVILAYVYKKYNSILAPILCHASANALSVLITYFAQDSVDMENQVEEMTAAQYGPSYIVMMVFFGAGVGLFLFLINQTVVLREKNNKQFV